MAGKLAERRQDVGIEVLAPSLSQPRPPVVRRNLRARPFQQTAVGHTRRTRCLAVQATETAINVRDERVTQRQPPLVHLHDLVDTSARRIHLCSEGAIRWTVCETKPAVHAARVQVPGWFLVRREIRVAGFGNSRSGAQKINLPRRTLFGSSACFTARICGRLAGAAGHGFAAPSIFTATLSSNFPRRVLTTAALRAPAWAFRPCASTRKWPTPTRPSKETSGPPIAGASSRVSMIAATSRGHTVRSTSCESFPSPAPSCCPPVKLGKFSIARHISVSLSPSSSFVIAEPNSFLYRASTASLPAAPTHITHASSVICGRISFRAPGETNSRRIGASGERIIRSRNSRACLAVANSARNVLVCRGAGNNLKLAEVSTA